MPHLNLKFLEIPTPETCLWEQFDDAQKTDRHRDPGAPSSFKRHAISTRRALSHTQHAACVYVRQSSPGQVEHNRESTARQYALADRACLLGWPKEQVVIIDEDLGLSGSGVDQRSGFARLTSEVALAHVGIVLGLEVSRLARNNADWYRLLELCGITDTLTGDADGIYHPALFNDRLLLGLKGTMSEAELHIIRARLDGGIRNKAARGELRRGLPVGLVWGEQDGEVRFHPDEAVSGAIRTIFERFAELGSARRGWLWFCSEGLSLPLQINPAGMPGPIRWVAPTYHAVPPESDSCPRIVCHDCRLCCTSPTYDPILESDGTGSSSVKFVPTN